MQFISSTLLYGYRVSCFTTDGNEKARKLYEMTFIAQHTILKLISSIGRSHVTDLDMATIPRQMMIN